MIANLYNKIPGFHNCFMGLNRLSLSVLFVVIISCNSQGKSDPHLYIEDSTWDFGTVIAGDTPNHVFKLKNQGGKVLHIDRIEAECACTATAPSTDKLPPGISSELKISLDTKDRQGKLVKRVDVYSNDPLSPVTTITLKASIFPMFTITPEYLHFGSNGTKTVTLTSHSEIGLQIQKLETSASYMSAHSSSTTIENGSVLHTILVNVNSKVVTKSLDVTENLRVHTNLSKHEKINIPIRIHLGGIVNIQPRKLFFGIVHQGEEKVRTAILSIPTGMDLHIENVDCEREFLVPSVIHHNSSTYHINVKLDSSAPVGSFSDTLNVYSKLSDLRMPIEIYGIVRK